MLISYFKALGAKGGAVMLLPTKWQSTLELMSNSCQKVKHTST
jgi:hypothetical protein